MDLLSLIVLAIGLSMDSFAVSICGGAILRKFVFQKVLKIVFWLSLFQATMPIIGWILGKAFQKYIELYDHWIAFGLLAIIGAKMIYESTKKEDGKNCFDPTKTTVLMGLGLATSIDAAIVGINFGVFNIPLYLPFIIIFLSTFIFSALGVLIGTKFGSRFQSKAEFFGGVVLILIGAKVLYEHSIHI